VLKTGALEGLPLTLAKGQQLPGTRLSIALETDLCYENLGEKEFKGALQEHKG
jgi:hypothetical protein